MIYVFLANGFEETEAITPIDCLRRAGKTVKTVGIGGKVITSSHGIPVTADITPEEIVLDSALEMVVLPGGMPGTRNLGADADVHAALSYCAAHGKKIGAICAAPSVIGKLGLLSGHRAVCFPGFEDQLLGAEIGTEKAVISGDYITARGAGAAMEFGLALVESLLGKETADALAQKMEFV